MEKKKNPSAFIRNTHSILQRPDLNHIIAWNEEGNGFIIYDLPQFEALILPQYFKHQKYTSFVRQLNMYGFHKQRHPETENYFQHETFRRGQSLSQIKRKPERKKKNDEQMSMNQFENQQNQIKCYMSEQKSENVASQQDLNPEQPNKRQDGGLDQNNKAFNWSLGSLCEQAILQNQILVKIHPILLSYEMKLKQQRIKQLRDQSGDMGNMNEMIASIGEVIRAETMKLSSIFEACPQ